MNETSLAATRVLDRYLPARFCAADAMDWIVASPVKSWKPLRFLQGGRGFVELLRMQPGAVMPLHRHTGDIIAFNLEGQRQLCTGEVIGPGGFVYEPPGNVDWWKIVGDQPMTALVVVMGEVEFLGPGGTVTSRATAATQLQAYHEHCDQRGIAPLDLVEA
jgi:2,4'-dihydroxyacetophenone dioxygenase